MSDDEPFDLQEEYMNELANQIKQEIDDSIIEEMMFQKLIIEDGWTRVNIMTFPFNSDIIAETSAWVHCNATGDYKYHKGCWYLEVAQDATALILRFS